MNAIRKAQSTRTFFINKSLLWFGRNAGQRFQRGAVFQTDSKGCAAFQGMKEPKSSNASEKEFKCLNTDQKVAGRGAGGPGSVCMNVRSVVWGGRAISGIKCLNIWVTGNFTVIFLWGSEAIFQTIQLKKGNDNNHSLCWLLVGIGLVCADWARLPK